MIRPPPISTLFPYTTLFRSGEGPWPAANVEHPLAGSHPAEVRELRRKQARVLAHVARSEEHTSELQSRGHLVCRLLLEKKKRNDTMSDMHNLMPTVDTPNAS